MINFKNRDLLQEHRHNQEAMKGMFYKVSSKEGKTVGYILGTVHLTNDHNRQLNDKITRCFEKSMLLAVELVPEKHIQSRCQWGSELSQRNLKLAMENDSQIFSKIADSITDIAWDIGFLQISDFIDNESEADIFQEKIKEVMSRLASETSKDLEFMTGFKLGGVFLKSGYIDADTEKTSWSDDEMNALALKTREFKLARRDFILKTCICLKMNLSDIAASIINQAWDSGLLKITDFIDDISEIDLLPEKIKEVMNNLASGIVDDRYPCRNFILTNVLHLESQKDTFALNAYQQFDESLNSWMLQQADLSSPGIDHTLIKKAEESGKEIIELEDIDDLDLKSTGEKKFLRIKPYSSEQVLEQIKDLVQMNEELAQGNLSLESFKKAIDKIETETFSRNVKMTEKINQIFLDASEKRLFVAVGAAHLPYQDGILELLTQKGWVITQI